jgi:hypothetical protein
MKQSCLKYQADGVVLRPSCVAEEAGCEAAVASVYHLWEAEPGKVAVAVET